MAGRRGTTSGRGPVTQPQKRRVDHPEHKPGTACDPILFGVGRNLCPNFVSAFPLINAAATAAAVAPAALDVSAAVATAAVAAAAAIAPAATAAAKLLLQLELPLQ